MKSTILSQQNTLLSEYNNLLMYYPNCEIADGTTECVLISLSAYKAVWH